QRFNPFTEKVACALALKGVEYLRTDVSEADEIKRLSPETQTLPVLEVDGKRVADSNDIIRWLEDLYPEPSLYSQDPKIRRQQESLADWSDSSFAFYWNRWRAVMDEHERAKDQANPGLLSRIHQHVDQRLGIEHEESADDIPGVRPIIEALSNRLDDLVGFLGSRPYFFSDQLSVADLAAFGMLLVMRNGPMPGTAQMLESRPTLMVHTAQLTKLTRQGTGPQQFVDEL
ncbi:MAG: glutathione S-transferase family protein, partial [bacterium]|nr:glutathione S-transferase family protein [bacterium]